MPRLETILDQTLDFCEWFQQKVHKDEEFVSRIVWSDEAAFKLNGTTDRHNDVYCVARMTAVPPLLSLTVLPLDKVALAFIIF
jgi:hypothetical protein